MKNVKVIHFEGQEDLADSSIGAPRLIYWPAYMYHVTLPQPGINKTSSINIFEEVVLNLADAMHANASAQEISDQCCLDPDLVKYILLKLRDKSLLDEHNQVIPEHIQQWKENTKSDTYVTAVIFQERVSGLILPHLEFQDGKKPLQRHQPEKRVWKINPSNTKFKAPTSHQVKQAIHSMRRRKWSYGDNSYRGDFGKITVQKSTREPIWLHCKIGIPKSDPASHKISHPFGPGNSPQLESIFEQRLQEQSPNEDAKWYRSWRQNLQVGFNSKSPNPTWTMKLKKSPYPELVHALSVKPGKSCRTLRDQYASVEWALFYKATLSHPTNAIRLLLSSSGSSQRMDLQEAAEHCGFKRGVESLCAVQDGHIQGFFEKKAVLDTVLAINLMISREVQSHPFHFMSQERPDLLESIRTLKTLRGADEHGAEFTGDHSAWDELAMYMVRCLCPDLETGSSAQKTGNDDDKQNLKLQATTNLQQEYGYEKYFKLNPASQKRLIESECFYLAVESTSNASADAIGFVCDWYSAVQGQLRSLLLNSKRVFTLDDIYLDAVITKYESKFKKPLPDALRHLDRKELSQAVSGHDKSLKEVSVALLLTLEDDQIDAILAVDREIFETISKLINLRKHGNTPVILSKDEIQTLRRSMHRVVKSLMEI